jgi:protocatechuate 3,4-dioxygenase beta subunit
MTAPCHESIGLDILGLIGIVRRDIRSSFGGLSGVADGVLLKLTMTIVSAATRSRLPGVAVYLWHCDRLGRYSLEPSGVTNQNYLRGVQAADLSGQVTFTTIFPGCYLGRWPHIHFEVYLMLASAGAVSNKVVASQLALPKAACDAVYATSGYESSATNLSQISLATDDVFSAGASLELPTMSGSVAAGFTAAITVAI